MANIQVLSSSTVSTSNKILKIQLGSYSVREINIESTQGVVCLRNVFGLECEHCLSCFGNRMFKVVAHNPSTGLLFPCILIMQFLSSSCLLESEYLNNVLGKSLVGSQLLSPKINTQKP